MFKKLKYRILPLLTVLLITIADVSISTSTFCHHFEPDCPEELLK